MIQIDQERCIGCGACAGDCLASAIVIQEKKATITKDCFHCGHCVAICPTQAVTIFGDTYEMEDVIPYEESTCRVEADLMLRMIKGRRSIRQFEDRLVPHAELKAVLEAGRFSPTGSNSQNVSYVVFSEQTEAFRELAMEEFRRIGESEESFAKVFPPPFSLGRVNLADDHFLFKQAPVVILTVSNHPVDAAIASANMELVAWARGLGMLYVGFVPILIAKSQKLREFLGLQEGEQIVTCLCMGYPAVKYLRTVPRKKAKINWR